jgi:hypothetical protein
VLDVDRFGAIVFGCGGACHVRDLPLSRIHHADGGLLEPSSKPPSCPHVDDYCA